MKLIANDSIHITSVKPDAIRKGEAFEVEPDAAKSLISRGLARPAGKAEKPVQNKMNPAPSNKKA